MPDLPIDQPEQPGGERRREGDRTLDMVAAVVSSLNDVITSLRLEIRMLGDSEKSGRRRAYSALAVVGLLIAVSLVQLNANYRQGGDIKRVVDFIEDCQNPDGDCAKRNAANLATAVVAVSQGVFDSLTCVLIQTPEERTDASIQACRARYFPK